MALVDDLIKEIRRGPSLRGDHALSRGAFLLLAHYCGWNNAQIARYLGISRPRVSKAINEYSRYCTEYNMPITTELLNTAPVVSTTAQFAREQWHHRGFREGLLTYIGHEAEARRPK